MLHSTTHMSLSLSLFSCFSSLGALPANSREQNSPQEQQQHSNANHTYRPNLNVLLPQPRLPINRPDEIILVPNNFRDAYLSSDDSDSEYERDEYFEDEDSEDNEQEEVKWDIKLLQFQLFLNRELTNMMMRVQKLQLEISQIGQEIENLQRRMGQSVL
ncbi:hypothetical protein ERO13_D06G040025v2 [Gossypium hirsutum]|uniref:Uncharacterized protein n=2 Tax=Gossypium TaxID=3633 RepID=A0A5J5QZE1_GOSBA|nr:hypothetical protein ES319_D06G045500v1 [Gossypium barbadense]KAG4140801.1 hypothetical protein ERO13_D06G040025v2 [Gossypium hirsutum]TYI75999.1 hypothetical protein E1A91_D06G046300v1 [Gossypium mustelinum]